MAHTKTGPTVAEVVALEDRLLAKDAEIERLTAKVARLDPRGITDMQHTIKKQQAEIERLRAEVRRHRDDAAEVRKALRADRRSRGGAYQGAGVGKLMERIADLKKKNRDRNTEIARLTRERDELRELVGRWVQWWLNDYQDGDQLFGESRALLDKETE